MINFQCKLPIHDVMCNMSYVCNFRFGEFQDNKSNQFNSILLLQYLRKRH